MPASPGPGICVLMGLFGRAAALFAATAEGLVVHSCALVSALYMVSKLGPGERITCDFAYTEPPLTDEEHSKTYQCRRWSAAKGSYRLTLSVADGPAGAALEGQAALLRLAAGVPHVQRWVSSFEGPSGTACLITEALMCGLPLSKLLEIPSMLQLGKPQHADMTKQVSQQLLQALAGLHKLHIVHGAVNAESVYLSSLKDEDGRRKFEATLCEFSGALQLQPGARVNGEMRHGRAVAGAEAASWAAPEVVEAALRGTDAGFAIEPPATDMWSLGCLLLLLTTGSKAFSEGSLSQLRREHRQWATARKAGRGDHSILVALDGLPRACAKLIARLLVPDPAHRITASDALQLSYFTASTSS